MILPLVPYQSSIGTRLGIASGHTHLVGSLIPAVLILGAGLHTRPNTGWNQTSVGWFLTLINNLWFWFWF
jgi:hypothetical protein